MKKIIPYLFILPALWILTLSPAQAADSNISSMAGIVMHLKHYPNGNEKEQLAAIVSDQQTTAGEKALASALKNMQHKVSGSDANALQQLQSDPSASNQERELATILLGIAHSPSTQDKNRLKALMH